MVRVKEVEQRLDGLIVDAAAAALEAGVGRVKTETLERRAKLRQVDEARMVCVDVLTPMQRAPLAFAVDIDRARDRLAQLGGETGDDAARHLDLGGGGEEAAPRAARARCR